MDVFVAYDWSKTSVHPDGALSTAIPPYEFRQHNSKSPSTTPVGFVMLICSSRTEFSSVVNEAMIGTVMVSQSRQ
jgi:hypothetical protein